MLKGIAESLGATGQPVRLDSFPITLADFLEMARRLAPTRWAQTATLSGRLTMLLAIKGIRCHCDALPANRKAQGGFEVQGCAWRESVAYQVANGELKKVDMHWISIAGQDYLLCLTLLN
jgi:hypothetical protein